MGRKTFESIGRPLPKRTNIVLSRTPYVYEGVIWKENFESAVDFVKEFDEIMLIGGGELCMLVLMTALCVVSGDADEQAEAAYRHFLESRGRKA